MTCKISDIVKASSSTEFRSDVQLSHYRESHNQELLSGYIFTKKAAAPKKSSIDILRYVCESFTPGNNPNRFVVKATYGHGKSHFALALANYFGKDIGSVEAKLVLSKIEHAVDPPNYGFFDSFKQSKKPFLIVILSGTDARDLNTQFFGALDLAVKDCGQEVELPFWYASASRFLENIDESKEQDVNNFLSTKNYDLTLLKERVGQQDSQTYDVCCELFLHLYKVSPNFNIQGLKQSVEWVSDNLCGSKAIFEGVLILFDEFSAFVRDYSYTMKSRPGTPLQDLLDGVDSGRGKVSFVAFSQHDPDIVASNLLHSQSLQNLQIQLSRLPKTERYDLHSSLEEVLDSYLKQDTKLLTEQLKENRGFEGDLFNAHDVAYDLYNDRYQNTLSWDYEYFLTVVTRGCYPLHPLTTALLCTVEFQETTNPRSVLGFVIDNVKKTANEPVYGDDGPNWILPISLVGYFKEMLGDHYRAYLEAVHAAGGADADKSELLVLQGMALQASAQIRTRGHGYEKVIGLLAGIKVEQSQVALEGLAKIGAIRYEDTKKIFMFWPAGRGGDQVDKILKTKLRTIPSLTKDVLQGALKRLSDISLISDIKVDVSWGNRDDWSAGQYFMSKDTFNVDGIKEIINKDLVHRLDGKANLRGLVIWLVAENNDDVTWFNNSVDKTLYEIEKKFHDTPIPLILRVPKHANSELSEYLRREYAFFKFTNQEIQEAGKEQYDHFVNQNQKSIKSELENFSNKTECKVMKEFEARIKTLNSKSNSIVLPELYSMAYRNCPRYWFKQYKSSSSKLKTAVKFLSDFIKNNDVSSLVNRNLDVVSVEIVNNFLGKWGLITNDLKVRKPLQGSTAFEAWARLDLEFDKERGAVPLKRALKWLVIPPYGYDELTAMILFSAWVGFNKHDLEISIRGRLCSVAEIPTIVREFYEKIDDIKLKMRNPDELRSKVLELRKDFDVDGFDYEKALNVLEYVDDFIKTQDDDATDEDKRFKEVLEKEIEITKKYDLTVDNIYSRLNSSNNKLDILFTCIATIKTAKMSNKVAPRNDKRSIIRDDINKKIRLYVHKLIDENKNLKHIEEYSLSLDKLTDLKKILLKQNYDELSNSVNVAIEHLNECREEFIKKDKDKELVSFLNAINLSSNLSDLEKYKQKLLGFKPISDPALNLYREKKESINKEITNLIDFIELAKTEILKNIDYKSIVKLEKNILMKYNRYEGKKHLDTINLILTDLAKIKEFYEKIEEIKELSSENKSGLADKKDRLKRSIEEYKGKIPKKYIENAMVLITNLDDYMSLRVEESNKWLKKIKFDLEKNERPSVVLKKLESIPEFLPDEKMADLINIKEKAQELLNNDHVLHIETIFTKINNYNAKVECLKRLNEILNNAN